MVSSTVTSETIENQDRRQEIAQAMEACKCWRSQLNCRYGGGMPAPLVPQSQRQYDGDNRFEYCEIWPA